ncbi:hypothetical protein [Cystobacter fuscus]|nr:hypothetical protein [Cystobacter fuscus]
MLDELSGDRISFLDTAALFPCFCRAAVPAGWEVMKMDPAAVAK